MSRTSTLSLSREAGNLVRTGVGSVWELVREEFLAVTVPQKLFIQNVRLGLFQRILQALCFGSVIGYCIGVQIWRETWRPGSYDTRLSIRYHGSSSAGPYEAALCQDVLQTQFGNDSYRSTKCGRLHAATGLRQQSEQPTIFIPTYVEERVEKVAIGGLECGQSVQHHCSGNYWRRHSRGFNSSAGASETTSLCSCVEQKEIFLENPEQQQISLFHGYEIELRNLHSWTEVENIEAGGLKTVIESDSNGMRTTLEKSGIMTVVMGHDGKPCHVSRKQRWLPAESQQGIYGTLREWLACAGVSLDDDPASFLPNTAGHALQHQVRTFGMAVHLRLFYDNSIIGDHHGIVCFVNVEVLPRVTPTMELLHLPLQGEFANAGQAADAMLATTASVQYGVQLTMSVSGSIRRFALVHFVQAIVSVAVIFTFPQRLTVLLALYGLGLVSEIYRRARRTRLSIRNAFQHAITKILLAENAFRGLTGSLWEGHACRQMRKCDVVDHLQEVFCPERDGGAQVDEGMLICLAQMLVHHVDQTDDGFERMTCKDFVQYCTEQDIFDVDCIMRFLVRERKESLLKRCFDTSAYEHEQAKATVLGRSFSRGSDCDDEGCILQAFSTLDSSVQMTSTGSSKQPGSRLLRRIQAIEANMRVLQEMCTSMHGSMPASPTSRGSLVQQVQFEVDLHLGRRVPELIKRMTFELDDMSNCRNWKTDFGNPRATSDSGADECVATCFSGDGGTEAERRKQSRGSVDLGMSATATEAEEAGLNGCGRRPSLPPKQSNSFKCNRSHECLSERSMDEGNKDERRECVEGEAVHHLHQISFGMAATAILTGLGQRIAKLEDEIAALCTQQQFEEAVGRLAAELHNKSCDKLEVQRRLEVLENDVSTCKKMCCCSNKNTANQHTEMEAAVSSRTPHVLPAACSGNAKCGSGPLPPELQSCSHAAAVEISGAKVPQALDCSNKREQKSLKIAASSTAPHLEAVVPANTHLLQVPNTLTPASEHWLQSKISRPAKLSSPRAATAGSPGTTGSPGVGFRSYLEPACTDASVLWTAGSSTASSCHAEVATSARNEGSHPQPQPLPRRLPWGMPREQRL